MVKVGLTGGIGSGKSTVAKIFEDKGVPVFYADKAGRDAEKDPIIRQQFIDIVGADIIIDGEIDRNKMRTKVFTKPEILSQVNALIGPYIIQKFMEFVTQSEEAGEPIIIMESAILFETNATKMFDFIVSVIADEETRFQRVMKRDKIPTDLILAKMNIQSNDSDKIELSDFIIINNGGYNSTESEMILNKQVETLLMVLLFSKN